MNPQTRFHNNKRILNVIIYIIHSKTHLHSPVIFLPVIFYFKSDAKQTSVHVASHESCLLKEVASKSSACPPGPQMMQSFTEEVRQLLRQPLEVSTVSLKTYTQKLQVSK